MKRDIFPELSEGFETLADERQGKLTLRTHKVQLATLQDIDAAELVDIREQLNMSRPVFAMYLRTNTRTLENWEQGRAKPNAQAVAYSPGTEVPADGGTPGGTELIKLRRNP